MGSGQENVEDPRAYPKEWRACLPPNSGDAKTTIGRVAVTAERCQGLSLLLLEWPFIASVSGKYRGAELRRTVFEKSGVKNAHSHRFRHTLATRLLEQGATFEQVADILGNSPAIVRKHYGKWSKGRQNNIDRLMLAHFETMPDTIPVTKKSHEELGAVN